MDSKFLSEAKATYPSLTRKTMKKKGKQLIIFLVNLSVPIYEDIRKVKIVFRDQCFDSPKIYCDGPTESKHRYKDNSLCIWHPSDKDINKWIYNDGLLQLLALIQLHLFREAFWRETGNWAGPEAEH